MGIRHHDEEPPRSPRAATFSIKDKFAEKMHRSRIWFYQVRAPLLSDRGATFAREVLSCVLPFSSLTRLNMQNHGPHVGIISTGWGQGSLATAVVIVQTGKQVGRAENGSKSLQGVHNMPGWCLTSSLSLGLQHRESRSESAVAQSCPTLCNSVDCSPPGSSVHGILQAGTLKWIAIPFSRGSS